MKTFSSKRQQLVREPIHSLNHLLPVLCLALFCAWTSAARADTIYVTSLADNGPGTLREALALAADGDTIEWDAPPGTTVLSSELLVTKSVTILGPGAARLAVDGDGETRVFYISPNLVVSISGMIIRNGANYSSPGGGGGGAGIYNDHSTLTISNCALNDNWDSSSEGLGGGIYNNGQAGSATLKIFNSTLSDNRATFNGGGIYNNGELGSATLEIQNSTLSGNRAINDNGGGIYNDGQKGNATLKIQNSTLSGNHAPTDQGGGIYNNGQAGSATLKIQNSTLSRNAVTGNALGGAIYNLGDAKGGATLEIGSTILDAGILSRNIFNSGGTVTSDGYNLSTDNGGGFLTGPGDQTGTDPLLGPLANNGGPTFTHALVPGSPAIDAGVNFVNTAYDQRGAGFPRTYDDLSVPNVPGSDGTDIGAFEGLDTNDFPNGVAAGDVDQSSAVLWAKSAAAGTVKFEYGRDPTFAVIDGAVDMGVDDPDVPAKVPDIDGLQAGTQYYYRARLARCPKCPFGIPATGKFRTPFDSGRHGLRFGVSSCWRKKPFVSIRNVPARDLDFFVANGDTVYADNAPNLNFFRDKYAANLDKEMQPEDNFLAFARASTAFYATIDDHEVRDNFAGGAEADRDDQNPDFGFAFWVSETDLYKDALTAFHDYWPIRKEYYDDASSPRTKNRPKLYRSRTFGKDAAVIVLDARSFRDKELHGVDVECKWHIKKNRFGEHRTMLSVPQRTAMVSALQRAQADGVTWKFVVIGEPIQNLGRRAGFDRFEGYGYERRFILKAIEEAHIRNVVFISGDIHGTIVNDLAWSDKPCAIIQKPHVVTTDMWDISTGPVEQPALFGRLFLPGAVFNSNLTPEEQNHRGEIRLNIILRTRYYPPIGLDDSRSYIPATLLEGQWLSINTYGWTEFEIDQATQNLTVTTWGVDWYCWDGDDGCRNETDYDQVMSRVPRVVSKFVVTPKY